MFHRNDVPGLNLLNMNPAVDETGFTTESVVNFELKDICRLCFLLVIF